MRIEDVSARVFRTTTQRHADTAGHAHPGPAHQVEMAILTIRTDTGDEGHCFSPPQIVREHVMEKFVRKVIVGDDPFDRERLWQELAHWQRGSAGQLTDRALAIVDCALWDLAGRSLGSAGAQADRGVPGQGAGLWVDHVRGRARGRARDAGGLRAVRAEAGRARVQGDQAAYLDAPGVVGAGREDGHQGLRGGSRGGGAGHPPDDRRLPLVFANRGAGTRAGAREARLRLDRGAARRAEHVELRVAGREPRHPGAGAGERGGQAFRPGGVDQGRGLRHPADRGA